MLFVSSFRPVTLDPAEKVPENKDFEKRRKVKKWSNPKNAFSSIFLNKKATKMRLKSGETTRKTIFRNFLEKKVTKVTRFTDFHVKWFELRADAVKFTGVEFGMWVADNDNFRARIFPGQKVWVMFARGHEDDDFFPAGDFLLHT